MTATGTFPLVVTGSVFRLTVYKFSWPYYESSRSFVTTRKALCGKYGHQNIHFGFPIRSIISNLRIILLYMEDVNTKVAINDHLVFSLFCRLCSRGKSELFIRKTSAPVGLSSRNGKCKETKSLIL